MRARGALRGAGPSLYTGHEGPGEAKGEGRVFQNVEPPRRRAAGGGLLALIGFMGFCLLVGMASGGITQTSVRTWYPSLTAPPGTPPNWVFPVVWTVLYLAMGLSAWLVWRRIDVAPSRKYAALRVWGWQLLLNALWTPAFFGARSPGLGLAVVWVLLAVVLLTVRAFLRVDRVAGALLLPYAAWVSYAAYLNSGFWWLNGG